jgi:hypothetical protein
MDAVWQVDVMGIGGTMKKAKQETQLCKTLMRRPCYQDNATSQLLLRTPSVIFGYWRPQKRNDDIQREVQESSNTSGYSKNIMYHSFLPHKTKFRQKYFQKQMSSTPHTYDYTCKVNIIKWKALEVL